jgi:hypothetical protein
MLCEHGFRRVKRTASYDQVAPSTDSGKIFALASINHGRKEQTDAILRREEGRVGENFQASRCCPVRPLLHGVRCERSGGP